MTTSNTEKISRKKMYCNTCKIETHHEVKAKHSREVVLEYDYVPEAQPFQWEDIDYRFWVCLGCDTGLLEETTWYNSEEEIAIAIYPPRMSEKRQPKEYRRLTYQLENVYKEIIASYNNELTLACAILLRALLEGIIIEMGITDQEAYGLEDKLTKLEEAQHLPANIVKSLEGFKFIGDDAAHRLKPPRMDELALAIDVMEDLLNFIYEVEYRLETGAMMFSRKLAKQIEAAKDRKEQEKQARRRAKAEKKARTGDKSTDTESTISS